MSDARPLHDIGHNQPNLAAGALAEMRAKLERFKQRREEFLASAKKVVINDRHDAGDAASLIGMSRDVAKLIDAVRVEIGGPYDLAAKAVTAEANEFWADVFSAMDGVQAKLTTFADEEQKRIRAQEAEQAEEDARRRAALAPAPAAGPSPPPPARPSAPPRAPKKKAYRGDLGHQAIVGAEDVIEIVDVRALPDMVLNSSRVKEAIIAVLKPMVRNGMAIEGITTSKQTTTSIRK